MKYLFDFHYYKRNFKNPLRTSHGLWKTREGIIIRLENTEGKISYSEIAPIPFFQTGEG